MLTLFSNATILFSSDDGDDYSEITILFGGGVEAHWLQRQVSYRNSKNAWKSNKLYLKFKSESPFLHYPLYIPPSNSDILCQ